VFEDGSYRQHLVLSDFDYYALFHFGLLSECFRAVQLFSDGTVVWHHVVVLDLKGLVNISSW